MEHLFVREVASALFLLLLAGARYYFVFASAHPADPSSPAINWARHIPAYFTSSVWSVYVAWLLLAPLELVAWDRWAPSRAISDVLGWSAILLLAAGIWLFCYSHRTLGRYWSIQIRFKQAHQLITRGPYRYIRHPLYTAMFLGYLGTLLALQSWVLVAWFPVFVASYVIFAKEEEDVMQRGFREAYEAYRGQTGMFLPKWSAIRAGAVLAATRVRVRRR